VLEQLDARQFFFKLWRLVQKFLAEDHQEVACMQAEPQDNLQKKFLHHPPLNGSTLWSFTLMGVGVGVGARCGWPWPGDPERQIPCISHWKKNMFSLYT
jgi:hypothetical protein